MKQIVTEKVKNYADKNVNVEGKVKKKVDNENKTGEVKNKDVNNGAVKVDNEYGTSEENEGEKIDDELENKKTKIEDVNDEGNKEEEVK